MDVVLDKCPGYNLYIGGFINLRRPKALKNCNITHIVSVLDWQFEKDAPLIKGYQHLHIPVDDVEDENLLQWFPRSNAFIEEGLTYNQHQLTGSEEVQDNAERKGSGVFIHCAMGKSRSATILLAYLLWTSRHHPRVQPSAVADDTEMVPLPTQPLSVVKALEILRVGRPIAEPNEGFMEQLHMYEAMNCPTTEEELKAHKIYRRWMNKRSVEESLRINQAPEMDYILFEDESDELAPQEQTPKGQSARERPRNNPSAMSEVSPGITAPDGSQNSKPSSLLTQTKDTPPVTIKCRKCRHVLATTPFIFEHKPPPHRDPNEHPEGLQSQTPLPPPQCAHIFLHPLSWMREVLKDGKMEGRLTCPNSKCAANLGKFAWTGLRCSCGGWETPGFALIRGKVDELISTPIHDGSINNTQSDRGERAPSGGAALRLPPNMKKGNL